MQPLFVYWKIMNCVKCADSFILNFFERDHLTLYNISKTHHGLETHKTYILFCASSSVTYLHVCFFTDVQNSKCMVPLPSLSQLVRLPEWSVDTNETMDLLNFDIPLPPQEPTRRYEQYQC